MKYLVIGGAGFLGGHLVGALLQKGHDVTVQDVISRDQATRLKVYAGKISYQWKSVLDVRDEDFRGFDYVLNMAAVADVPLAISSPRWVYEQNLGGVLALLEALRYAKGKPTFPKKILFMSSENVYGNASVDRLPLQEDELPRPVDSYAASKVAIEALCHAYAIQWKIPIAIVRSSTLYGERSRLNQAIPIFIRQALQNQPITIEGDGSQSRDFSYVGNTVQGIIRAVESSYEFGIWNLGSGEETSIKELASLIIGLTKSRSEITYKGWRPGEQGIRLSVSIAKAKKELGYEPHISMEEGLKRTIEWLKEIIQAKGG